MAPLRGGAPRGSKLHAKPLGSDRLLPEVRRRATEPLDDEESRSNATNGRSCGSANAGVQVPPVMVGSQPRFTLTMRMCPSGIALVQHENSNNVALTALRPHCNRWHVLCGASSRISQDFYAAPAALWARNRCPTRRHSTFCSNQGAPACRCNASKPAAGRRPRPFGAHLEAGTTDRSRDLLRGLSAEETPRHPSASL